MDTTRLTYKPPQIAVYLNLNLIKKHQIQYRPQLLWLEDMIFRAECVLKCTLTVCRLNELLVYDVGWKNSGASSVCFTPDPSAMPQDNTKTLSDSHTNTPTSRGRSNPVKLIFQK